MEQGLFSALECKQFGTLNIDIQYIVKGSEKMGYANIDSLKTTIEYNDEKDILFGTAEGDLLTVSEGMFALFTPEDAHMPGLCIDSPQAIKKVVVKILL